MGSAHAPGGEVIGVEVPGGSLAVEIFSSGGTEPVLAIHGISSQRKLWNWLRAAEPGLSLIAPPGLTSETLPAVFADRLARLDREWPSVREYAESGARASAGLITAALTGQAAS